MHIQTADNLWNFTQLPLLTCILFYAVKAVVSFVCISTCQLEKLRNTGHMKLMKFVYRVNTLQNWKNSMKKQAHGYQTITALFYSTRLCTISVTFFMTKLAKKIPPCYCLVFTEIQKNVNMSASKHQNNQSVDHYLQQMLFIIAGLSPKINIINL